MSMSVEDATKVREGFPRPFPNIPSNVVEQFRLDGKVLVVNGAADGLGYAVAEGYAEAGGNVALWYNSNDAAIEKARLLSEQHSIKATAYKVDVSDAQQIQDALKKVLDDFGKIDVYVANAGMAISKPILEQTLEEYRKQMSVNVDGVVFSAKYAGEIFKRQGFGNFIITSSMSAHIVNVPTDQPVYNGSKAFITHFGKSLAREWREFARVNIVSPGFFDTKMGASPEALNEAYRMAVLGRQGHVKEIKGLYLYLASDASTYMTVTDHIRTLQTFKTPAKSTQSVLNLLVWKAKAMSETNPSCLLYGPGDARFEDQPVPEIEDPNDVIIKVAYTGVCGSDVHFWTEGGFARKVSDQQPLVMGHEASGIIHQVGPAVSHLKPGDRVSIEPGFSCKSCDYCKSGRYNVCQKMKFAADPPSTHGTLSRFFKIPQDFAYKLPDCISLEEAVLAEPLSVAIHGVRLADIRPGQNVIVQGAGAIGYLTAATALAYGARKVVITDIKPEKLEFAKQGLQCHIFIPESNSTPEQEASRLKQEADLNQGADVVLECTGVEISAQTGILSLAAGGVFVQIGLGKPMQSLPVHAMCEKEIVMKTCFRYGPGDFKIALGLLESGKVSVTSLISSVVPFEDAPIAWAKTMRGEGIKNLIRGASLESFHFLRSRQGPIDPKKYAERTKRILKTTPVIDGHNDLPFMLRLELKIRDYDGRFDFSNRLLGHTDLQRLRQDMVGGQFWSVYVDYDEQQKRFEDPSVSHGLSLTISRTTPIANSIPRWIVRDTLEQIDVTRRFIREHLKDLEYCGNSACALKAFRSGRIPSMIGIESGPQVGGSIASIRQMYELGAWYMTIIPNCDNALAMAASAVAAETGDEGGTLQAWEKGCQGDNWLGMMVDLSHVSHQTITFETFQMMFFQVNRNGGIIMALFLNRSFGMSNAPVGLEDASQFD
ncbi:putative xylitol dehydrogenase [Fusarium heterosporum]|uniref:L-arabinitol 4-dehydrogenase n=1 Tax=Fusarium heterosporum TaxID=42747 RepID=A0A8H5SZC9_FUSHE|nr:putative xylitol dehydrogenase [Fusarium heterosporum]